LRLAEWGSTVNLHCKNPEPLMSALGQNQTFSGGRRMSTLPPKADINQGGCDVRFVPNADILRCGKERRYWITSSV
jgi:hypothetical protein